MNRKTATFRKNELRTKKAGDGAVIVEGWANMATVDRGNEKVNPDAYGELTNFRKNGIMLFNHDQNKPIGKMVEVRPTDKGLYFKGRISKSKDPFVSYVRDLIEEGILNAFSIGFESKKEHKNEEGVTEITDLDLFEVSVVSLPMNQDSIFSLSSKSMQGMEYKAVKDKVLKFKGAYVAAAVQSRMEQLSEAEDFDRSKVMVMLSEQAGISEDQLASVLSGDVTPVPEEVLSTFSEVLGIDMGELQKLNNSDVEAEEEKEVLSEEEGKKNDEAKREEEPEAKEEEKDQKAEDDQKEEEPESEQKSEEPKSEKAGAVVVAIQVPKSSVGSMDEAVEWAIDNGWKAEGASEEGEYYVFAQDEYEGENTRTIELEEGIMAVIGLPTKQQEQPSDELTSSEEKSVEATDKANPCEEDKSAVCDDETKSCDDMEGSTKQAIEASDTTTPNANDNPFYEQAKQTNVLLGELIAEFRGLTEKLATLMAQPVEQEMEEVKAEEEADSEIDEVHQKMYEDGLKRLLKLKETLSVQ